MYRLSIDFSSSRYSSFFESALDPSSILLALAWLLVRAEEHTTSSSIMNVTLRPALYALWLRALLMWFVSIMLADLAIVLSYESLLCEESVEFFKIGF